MTRDEQLAQAVDRMDVAGTQQGEDAWVELRPLGIGIVRAFVEAYPRFRTWQGRTALVYHATRYARISDEAFQLGLMAMDDRSYMVRHRACALLAYSLRHDALPALERAAGDANEMVATSALAARNAILAGNHHLFVDRSLSGRAMWHVNDGDGERAAGTAPPLPSRFQRWRLGIRPVPPLSQG